jgi:hypothetical protein
VDTGLTAIGIFSRATPYGLSATIGICSVETPYGLSAISISGGEKLEDSSPFGVFCESHTSIAYVTGGSHRAVGITEHCCVYPGGSPPPPPYVYAIAYYAMM